MQSWFITIGKCFFNNFVTPSQKPSTSGGGSPSKKKDKNFNSNQSYFGRDGNSRDSSRGRAGRNSNSNRDTYTSSQTRDGTSSSDNPRMKAAEAALARLDRAGNMGFAEDINSADVPEGQMAVRSVRFVCPAISDEMLPAKLWRPRIVQYLTDLSKTDPGLAAVLKIRTLNSNQEAVEECVQILTTYLKNVLSNPTDPKYRVIKLSNRIFVEKVQPIAGALGFLEAAGFVNSVKIESDGVVETLALDGEFSVENVEMLLDALRTAEPLFPVVFRDPIILKPQEAKEKIYLPEDFYDLTAQELTVMYKKRVQKQQEDEPLMTKAMREKKESNHLAKYKFSLLRVRFPDTSFLQGTFTRYDTQKSIREFIDSCLREPLRYSLYCPHSKNTLSEKDDSKTLYELRLIPSVVLHLIPVDPKRSTIYLQPDLLKNAKKI
ncbi:unnamed protein product [Nesidiocoris tenuis]|uniref:UBX domain-containing protein n=1 Tax=Nesidiocoris tenuis TaxID=355587 RepID=A0A6H5HRF4_9HEMI|nr:unnamed protein product [Nesidiocoris tenuis]